MTHVCPHSHTRWLRWRIMVLDPKYSSIPPPSKRPASPAGRFFKSCRTVEHRTGVSVWDGRTGRLSRAAGESGVALRVGVPTLTHRAVEMADYVLDPKYSSIPPPSKRPASPAGRFLTGAPHGGAGRGASAERRPVGADRCRSAPVVLGGAWQASAIAAQAGLVRGGDPMRKQRLDTLLAERGLFSSRSRAAASVMAGEVCVGQNAPAPAEARGAGRGRRRRQRRRAPRLPSRAAGSS